MPSEGRSWLGNRKFPERSHAESDRTPSVDPSLEFWVGSTGLPRLECAMPASPFAFTPAEWVALDIIRDERPETLAFLEERLAPVVGELSRTCQGWVVTECP